MDFNHYFARRAWLVLWLGVGTFGNFAAAQVSTFPAPPSLPAPVAAPVETPPPSPAPGAPATVVVPPAVEETMPASPVTAATLDSMSALDNKVALEPGDRISFRVIEDQDQPVSRVVTDTGEVDFPYVGRLRVAGETCQQVALELKRRLEVDYYKRATVILGLDVIAAAGTNAPRSLVWIVGEIRQVGPQELVPGQPTTLSQAILRAGGFGEFADQRRVRLVHRSEATERAAPATGASGEEAIRGQVFDVKSVFAGKSRLDPIVAPNDLIVIPKRLVNF